MSCRVSPTFQLVKSHSAATSTGLPDFVEPMQAKPVDSMRPGDWIYEIKFDGYRALALRSGSETRVLSRNEKDLGGKRLGNSTRSRRASSRAFLGQSVSVRAAIADAEMAAGKPA